MKTNHSYLYDVAMLSVVALLSCLTLAPTANAQRRRVYGERGRSPHMVIAPVRPLHPHPLIVGGRRYFYDGGYYYRGGRRGYVMVPAPLGARMRVLPYGFLRFRVGPVPYYYFGGVYYQYIPDDNVYVVVQKPSGAPSEEPAAATATEDKAALTDGTTVSGTFVGAGADSVQFQVNGHVQSIPISKITSINFAPSAIDTTGEK